MLSEEFRLRVVVVSLLLLELLILRDEKLGLRRHHHLLLWIEGDNGALRSLAHTLNLSWDRNAYKGWMEIACLG